MVVLLFRKYCDQTNKQTTLMDGLKKRMENTDHCVTEFENRLSDLNNRKEICFKNDMSIALL
jgi:hypothetical protein